VKKLRERVEELRKNELKGSEKREVEKK